MKLDSDCIILYKVEIENRMNRSNLLKRLFVACLVLVVGMILWSFFVYKSITTTRTVPYISWHWENQIPLFSGESIEQTESEKTQLHVIRVNDLLTVPIDQNMQIYFSSPYRTYFYPKNDTPGNIYVSNARFTYRFKTPPRLPNIQKVAANTNETYVLVQLDSDKTQEDQSICMLRQKDFEPECIYFPLRAIEKGAPNHTNYDISWHPTQPYSVVLDERHTHRSFVYSRVTDNVQPIRDSWLIKPSTTSQEHTINRVTQHFLKHTITTPSNQFNVLSFPWTKYIQLSESLLLGKNGNHFHLVSPNKKRVSSPFTFEHTYSSFSTFYNQ